MILFRRGFPGTCQIIDVSECVLIACVDIKGKQTFIVNIYAPSSPKDKIVFFDDIINEVKEVSCEAIAVRGDFNCVLHNDLDIVSREKKHAENIVSKYNDVLLECNLLDTWRLF